MTEWRSLDWLPRFEISEHGDLRRTATKSGRPTCQLLSGCISEAGYRRYIAHNDGKPRNVSAHRLVCEAWHGPPPFARAHAAHNDGNPLNNHYTNLRWATAAENNADSVRHGTRPRGANHYRAKLDAVEVQEIRRCALPTKILAQKHGVSRSCIHRIRQRITYREVA